MRIRATARQSLKGLAVCSFLLGAGASCVAVMNVVSAARDTAPVLFHYGLNPVTVQAPSAWTNESCAKCHAKEYDSWVKSRHALAADNDHFKVELLDPGNRQQYCLNCHAPRVPGATLLPTQEPVALDALYQQRPEWLRAGVDCLTCHVRDGKILATRVTSQGTAAHPMRSAPELGRAEFCAGCHQFSMKDTYFPDSFRGHFQQESLDEFLEFRSAGNDVVRCHDCHMPHGDHFMPGGYSDEMVKSAVDLELAASWNAPDRMVHVEVTVQGGFVGHRIPGGEAFRFLSVVTFLEDADGRPLIPPSDARTAQRKGDAQRSVVERWPRREKMQRLQGAFESGKRDEPPLPDTRLFSGETRTFRYASPVDAAVVKQPLRARAVLYYHLMGAGKAEMFRHSPSDVMRIIRTAEKTLNLRASPEG